MANTSTLYARIDSKLKNDAESILSKLGISPSTAITMLYSQIILHRGIPFDVSLPADKRFSLKEMTKEEIDAELIRGLMSLTDSPALTPDEVDRELAEEFGI